MICGKMITCWDYLKRPCRREAGHAPNLCNPFGSDHPMDPVKVKSPDQLYERVLQAAGLTRRRVAA